MTREQTPSNTKEMENDQAKPNLESFINMDWGREIAPLAYFLNLTTDDLSKMYNDSPFRGQAPPEDVFRLHNDFVRIMESLDSDPGEKQLQQIEKELTSRLANIKNRAFISKDLRVYVEIDIDSLDMIDILWADFIFVFLARDWRKDLGRCGYCRRWFQKAMKNQIYDTNTCKVKAHYYRNRKKNLTKYERSYKGKAI